MNWFRILMRFTLVFFILYLLGYVVPGFSGLTIPIIALIGAAIALALTLIERSYQFGSNWQRAVVLFLTSAVVIYFSVLFLVERPPVASAAFASLLVSLVELTFLKPIRNKKKMLS